MKKKWALWKTIVTVFASVILVAGVTIGGIYLAGGFDKDVVQPQDISFVLDEKLYDLPNGQFEVTKDFSLTITTQTPEFTESKVTLSFNNADGSHVKEDLVNGTISDGKITVPKVVMINEPFTVRLNRSLLLGSDGKPYLNDKGEQVDWITGGISVLRATAANLHINPIDVKIAVDVPVYSMSVDVCDMNGNVVSQITEGDHFIAKANYFPTNSKYMYSDNLNANMQSKREKLAYFESKDTTEVTFVYDENGVYFQAGNMSNKNSIVGYTFQSADIQEQVLANFEQTASGAELYNVVLSYLAAGDSESVSNKDQPSNVEIVEATISGFTLSQVGQTLEMTAGVKYTMTMNRNEYADGFIGAEIRSTNGDILTSMLRNVAISFETQDAQGYHPATDLSVVGGKSIVVDGVTYYFANTNVRDLNNAFWELYTAGSYRFRMTVVLMVPNPDTASGYEIYSESNIPIKNVMYLTATAHEEQDVSWASNEDITMTLDFDGENILPATKMLETYKVVPSQNIFKTVVFFAYFGNSASDPDVVLGKNGYLSAHAGEYTIGTQSYYLYPLDGSELTVADVGDFELFFATVQTQADNSFNYDSNNRYVIVKSTLDSLRVHVTKTLHQGSVTGCNFSTDSTTGFIYEGADEKINLLFTVEANSWGVFKEQLESNDIDLHVYDTANNDISNYFTAEYTLIESDRQVNYTLTINGALNLKSDVKLGSVKLFDQFSKKEWLFDHGDFNLTFYTPSVSSISLSSDVVDFGKTITVTQELSSESKFVTNISYYVQGQTNPTVLNDLDRFIGLLKVVVVDQHGNAEIFAEDWTFATDKADAITVNGKSFSFKTIDNATAGLWVSCREITSSAKLNFNISSVGIQSLKYDASKEIHNGPLEDADFTTNANAGEVSVTKYGSAANGKIGDEASYGKIVLHDLVRLYTDADATQLFPNSSYQFNFSAQYLYSLNDETILNLFGNDGMIYVNWNTDNSHFEFSDATNAETIRKELLATGGMATVVTNIYLRHDFSSDHAMSFVISDVQNSGAVKINLNLTLQANVSISGTSSMDGYAADPLAMKSDLMIEHKAGVSESLQDKLKQFIPFEGYTYYVVDDFNGGYILSRDMTKPDIAVGYINSQGHFDFYDFWNVEENYYNVTLYLDDVNNPFALSYLVNFTIKRNIQFKVVENKVYNYFSAQGEVMGPNGFFTYSRISGNATLDTISYRTELENADKSFLRFSDTVGHTTFARNETNAAFFGYNVKTLTQNFIFSIVDSNDNAYEIATLPLIFGLGESFSYQELAYQLYKMSNIDDPAADKDTKAYHPQVESYQGIDYVLVDKDTWFVNKSKGAYTFSLAKTYTLNGVKYTQTNYDLPGEANISFLNNTTSLLGLNDPSCYLIVVISSSDGSIIAKSILPLIISNIGLDFIHYTSVTGKDTFEIAKTGVDTLIEQGIYQTVEAGQSFIIASQYDVDDKVEIKETNEAGEETGKIIGTTQVSVAPGFLFPNDSALTTAIKVVPSVKGYQPDLVKRIWQDSEAPNSWHITLNHLSSEIPEAYVCLRFEISNGSYVEPFFYVLKVLPDTTVLAGVYAFNGGSEYISGTVGETVGGVNGINLSEKFGDETLHPGEERFRVDVYNGDSDKNVFVKKLVEDVTLSTATFVGLDGLGKDYTAISQKGKNYYLKNSEAVYGVAYSFASGTTLYERGAGDIYTPSTDKTLNGTYTAFKTQFSGDFVSVEQDGSTYYLKAQTATSVGGTYYFDKDSKLYQDSSDNLGTALQFSYKVVSVSVDSQVLTKEEDYASYLSITFSEDGRMLILPKKDSTMTILLQRIYSGGLQDDALSVVGGVIEYKFVLNSTVNYSLQFKSLTTKLESVTANGNEGEWTVLATDIPWDQDGDGYTPYQKDNTTYYLKNDTANQETQYTFAENTALYTFDGNSYKISDRILSKAYSVFTLGNETYRLYDNDNDINYYLCNADAKPGIVTVQKVLFSKGLALYTDKALKNLSGKYLDADFVTRFSGEYTEYQLEEETYYLENSMGKPCYNFAVGTAYYEKSGDSYTEIGKLTEAFNFVPQIQMSVKLLSTASSGDSSTSSVVYGKLKATWRAKDADLDIYDVISSISYDNMTGILSLTRSPYLNQDQSIIGSFYTDYGYLGTLTIHVGASMTVQIRENTKEIVAGSTVDIQNYIGKVTLNGEEVPTANVNVSEVKIFGDDSKWVSFNSPNLIFYANSEDKEITITVTITAKGNAFTFDMTLHIQKNITQKQNPALAVGKNDATAERITGEESIVAGNSLALESSDLFTLTSTNNFNAEYTWEAVSGGAYITEKLEKQTAISIPTKNVGELGVNVVVMITVHLYHMKDNVKIFYDCFKVRYTFNIVANTEITVHYPNPSGTEELTEEYLANNATFADARNNFFEKPAMFNDDEDDDKNRVVVKAIPNSVAGIGYTVDLYQIQNASISYDSGTQYLSIEDGKNHVVNTINNTVNIQNMQFHIGTYDSVKNEYINDGTESYATFLITSNGVSRYYKVVLMEKVLSLSINQVNTDADNVETFYVEDLAGKNNDALIFANGRLLSFTVASVNENPSIDSVIAADYRVVLQNGANYKIHTLRLDKNDIGKRKYFDLGKSYDGYSYVGTFVNNTENFDKNGEFSSDTAKPILDASLYSRADMPHLASRIEMTYHGLPIAYEYVSTKLSFSSNYPKSTTEKSISKYKPEPKASEIDQTVDLSNFIFKMGNGQSDTMGYNDGATGAAGSVQFSSTYIYLTTVDIAVENNVIVNGKFESHVTELYVNQEVNSLISDANIYHPSTKRQLSAGDLTTGGMAIDLSIVGLDANESVVPGSAKAQIISEYGAEIFTPYYNGNENNKYLAISVVQPNTSVPDTSVVDYRITGFGASNNGNYVLLYLTYKVDVSGTTYTKDFFLVYKVLPDYQIQYVNTTIQDEDENNVISNESNPYVIYTASGQDGYGLIQVAGGSSDSRIVTVKHQNGNNKEKDVGASGFTYTLNYDKQSASNLTYNIKTNVETKLQNALGGAGWTSISEGNPSTIIGYRWQDTNDNASLSLSGVSSVMFGSQSYMLEAEDQYGYKFKVFFTLASSGDNPAVVESNLSITEGEAFDIGAVYNILNIATVGSDKIDIIPTTNSNPSTANYRMINIANLEAWGYSKDYTSTEEGATAYLKKDGSDGYEVNSYNAFEEDKMYLKRPNFADVRVTEINWYKAGIEKPVGTETISFDSAKKLATQNGLVFNETGISYRDAEAAYKMPKLQGDAYGASSSVELTMVISLTYEAGSNTEIYNLSTPIVVYRDYTFISKKNNIVQDGAQFDISDYIAVNTQSGSVQQVTYLDDTVQFTLPAYSNITYSITTNGNTDVEANPFTLTNTYGYSRTFNVSISNVLGTTPGDNELQFTILGHGTSPIDDEYFGYYIRYNNSITVTMKKKEASNLLEIIETKNGTESKKDLGEMSENYSFTFKISGTGGKDTINIVNPIQLANDLTPVTKYYLASLKIAEKTYQYQVAQDYNVSGYYHSLNMNYAGSYKSVDRYLKVEDGINKDTHQYIAPLAGWTDGMTLNYAVQEDVIVGVPCDEFNDVAVGKVYFKMADQSSSGAATIDATGQIRTTASFRIASQYLNISIYMKVSGLKGDWSKETDNDKLLGTARIMLDAGAKMQAFVAEKENVSIKPTFIGYKDKKQSVHYTETITITDVAGKTIQVSMQSAILGKDTAVGRVPPDKNATEVRISYPVVEYSIDNKGQDNRDSFKYRTDINNVSVRYHLNDNTPVFSKIGDVYTPYLKDDIPQTVSLMGLSSIVITSLSATETTITEGEVSTTYKIQAYTDPSGQTYYLGIESKIGGTATVYYTTEYYLNKDIRLQTFGSYWQHKDITDAKGWNAVKFNVDPDTEGFFYILGEEIEEETPYAMLYVPLGDFGAVSVDFTITKTSVEGNT